MTEQELIDLKKEIEDIKQETSELKGENKSLLKRLKSEWKCATIKEAKALVKKLEKEKLTIENEIEKGLKELDKYFE